MTYDTSFLLHLLKLLFFLFSLFLIYCYLLFFFYVMIFFFLPPAARVWRATTSWCWFATFGIIVILLFVSLTIIIFLISFLFSFLCISFIFILFYFWLFSYHQSLEYGQPELLDDEIWHLRNHVQPFAIVYIGLWGSREKHRLEASHTPFEVFLI